MSRATYGDHKRFCEVEGWSRSRRTGHDIYELQLPDGQVLWTKVSHGSDSTEYRNLFPLILREQLKVTEDEFWACVAGTPPARPSLEPPSERQPLEYKLYRNLTTKVGLSKEEVGSMTPEEAKARWCEYLGDQRSYEQHEEG